MQSDTPSPRFPSRCSVRALCLGTAVLTSLVLLVWMYTEQSHLELCTQLVATGGRQESPLGREVGLDRPIQVFVNVPPANVSVTDGQTAADRRDKAQLKSKWDYNWDRLNWASPSDANGVPTRTLVLVRHGKYDLNTGHLTDIGRQQANLTGLRLRQLAMGYDSIVHSTMDRALETAQLVHAHLADLPISADPIIAEGGPVPPEPTLGYWSLPDRTYFVEGPRLEAAFRKYFYRASRAQTRESVEILVGHGNIFRYLSLRALQLPADAWMRVFLPHGSITLLHVNPDSTVTMTKFGDSGHFPPELVTI